MAMELESTLKRHKSLQLLLLLLCPWVQRRRRLRLGFCACHASHAQTCAHTLTPSCCVHTHSCQKDCRMPRLPETSAPCEHQHTTTLSTHADSFAAGAERRTSPTTMKHLRLPGYCWLRTRHCSCRATGSEPTPEAAQYCRGTQQTAQQEQGQKEDGQNCQNPL